jgi:hypothetical protein
MEHLRLLSVIRWISDFFVGIITREALSSNTHKHKHIMPGIESFGRMPPAEPTRCEIENARQMPVIDSGVSNIKLGLFTRLSRKFQKSYDAERAVSLAYCVTYSIFCEPIKQSTFEAFARTNSDVIEHEIGNAFGEEELAEPISLAYAARMIALGWETRNPFNPTANQLTERATDNDMAIPNIVQMWGAEAIVKFFRYSQEFMVNTLDA